MVMTLFQFSQMGWREICKKVKKAVVYIDNECAECLHWNGGLMLMMRAGALTVKEFSAFESDKEKEHKKAVFILSSPVFGTTKVILQDIIQNSSFDYCVLITSANARVHHFAKYGGHQEGIHDMFIFHALEEEMLEWMGNKSYAVEVIYSPLFIVPLTEMMFLTPTFRNVFPITDAHIARIRELQRSQHKVVKSQSLDSLSSVELTHLPLEAQISVHHLVGCLHTLFTQLEIREDIYSLGHLSGLVANQLEILPEANNRRKTAANHCSLILIDRTLDLASVTTHDTESLLDRILAVLPRLPGHSSDVAVNMSPVCDAKVSSPLGNIVLAPGCLAHPNIDLCSQVLEWLVNKPQKDILLSLHHHLSTLAPGGGSDRIGKLTRVTPHSIDKQVALFRGHKEAIYQCSGLLQQALAVTQTLRAPRSSQLDTIVSIEKLLVQNLGCAKDGVGILSQVTQLLRTRRERGLLMRDILGLLIHLFSLAGTDFLFPAMEQSHLLNALKLALYEDRGQLQGNLSELVNSMAENDFAEIAGDIFSKLQYIASARKALVRYRTLLSRPTPSHPLTYHSLLHQLMADVLHPDCPDLPDLTCKSTGLKDLLKSGFSLLLNRPRQQHPLDNPQLIVFILGGITAQEVKLVQDMVISSGQQTQVLVGGTRLLSPNDTVEAIFFKDPLMQQAL
ncbi:Sec1 family domain-containing protein 2 [Cryptotermes secundus]|uniref:Sec1 family domain-containing protein 2 n=2 Tax=Cryptotermes secundus TaxID=105785 RepID=A0A2J7RM52_9NEOP|nr:sec1 family domain-containing protein 2 isoform X2 [Cryptotermes secundus]PNF41889.1 Sec1 family domain-containing protein 2 [Cryptotermes secundus]